MGRLDGFIGRTRGERIGVAIMWVAIVLFAALFWQHPGAVLLKVGPDAPGRGGLGYFFGGRLGGDGPGQIRCGHRGETCTRQADSSIR